MNYEARVYVYLCLRFLDESKIPLRWDLTFKKSFEVYRILSSTQSNTSLTKNKRIKNFAGKHPGLIGILRGIST